MQLDDMLTTEDAAKWLQMTEKELLEKTTGVRPQIPAFRINQRVIRFHPRTIIAKLAADAGVSRDIISITVRENRT